MIRNSAFFALLALAGCGGGSGGGTALPVTPVPPPPPPPPTYASINDPTKSVHLDFLSGASMIGIGWREKNNEPATDYTSVSGGVRPRDGEISLSYNAEKKEYNVQYRGESAIYSDKDLVGEAEDGKSYDIFDESDPVNWIDKYFSIYHDKDLTLTYMNIGIFTVTKPKNYDNGDYALEVNTQYFAFGHKTEQNDMPRSGKGAYNFVVASTAYSSYGFHQYFGDGKLNVDFSTGDVVSKFDVKLGAWAEGNKPQESYALSLEGSIFEGSNRLNGTIISENSSHAGNFTGNFFGPAAEEVGVTFFMQDANGGGLVGAIAGERQ